MGILNKVFDKKGQLQIQETILAVFIIIIIIIFGIVFFYRVESTSIKDEFNQFQREKLTVDFITLGDLPEFSCSKAGIKESCIDAAKLIVFMNLNNSRDFRDYYFESFGYKNITIYQIYPSTSSNSNKCSPSKLSDCGVWEVYTRKPTKINTKLVIDTPVSLYFPDKDEYGIGIMIVEAYNV